jgi:LysM repeat protein
MSGWVDSRYLELHPEGAEGATGREDPTLAKEGYQSVTVVDNQTLGEIAEEYGVSLSSLENINDGFIVNPSLIYPGDQVYLPKNG